MNKIIILGSLILLFLVGCSNEEDYTAIISDYEEQIITLKKENEKLKDELLEMQGDYSSSLQTTDRDSRRIMSLIAKEDFETLRTEYGDVFEVKDDFIHFKEPAHNMPFAINLAGQPMFIGFFNKYSEGIQISYYIDNPDRDDYVLAVFSYDKEGKFEYILLGDR